MSRESLNDMVEEVVQEHEKTHGYSCEECDSYEGCEIYWVWSHQVDSDEKVFSTLCQLAMSSLEEAAADVMMIHELTGQDRFGELVKALKTSKLALMVGAIVEMMGLEDVGDLDTRDIPDVFKEAFDE